MASRLNPRRFLYFTIHFFFPILHSSAPLSSSSDNLFIACGSIFPITLHDHRIFLPDSSYLASGNSKISISADAHTNLSNSYTLLYQTARVLTSPSIYEFHISRKGTHIIRLHFYPFFARSYDLLSAQFHVLASDFVLLSNYTPTIDSPMKEFILRVDDEKLVITIIPVNSFCFAFVNAIEVISAPAGLVQDKVRLIQDDQATSFDGLSDQAMETLFRINVGGSKVTPFNDTLWRTWIEDTDFFSSNTITKIVHFSSRIRYQKDGASREIAPDSVYNTARILSAINSSVLSSRMTWKFPVDKGYMYLIRMHFCDIASLSLNELYFNVYINGFLACENLDISSETDQVLASPYFVDFVADVGSSGLLSVSVGSSNLSDHFRVDGLLNGLEIMKINNTLGILNGELPFTLVLHSSRRGVINTAFRSITCLLTFGLVFIIGFMLILRLKAESRNIIAWSLLPMDAPETELAK